MNQYQDFINTVERSSLTAKQKLEVVQDYRAFATAAGKEVLDRYYYELQRQYNRESMVLKHPAFADFFNKQ